MTFSFGRMGSILSVVILFCQPSWALEKDSDGTDSRPDKPAPKYERVDRDLDSALQSRLAVPQGPITIEIDLPTVLRLAGTDALEVQLASERVTEARAQTLAADMKFLPRIGPEFTNGWHHGEVQATGGQFQDVHKQFSSLGAGANAEWRLGESVFSSLAARRREQASQEDLKATTDQARIDAVNGYYNLVLFRAGQAIVEDRLKQADETIRLAQTMLKRGAGLLSEEKRAEAARAEVLQRLVSSKEQVRLASLALTETLHIDPLVTLIPHQEPQDTISLVSLDKDLTALISDSMSRRPELAQSRAFWSSLDKERRAAFIAPLIPAIRVDSFGGGLGRHPGTLEHSLDTTIGLQWTIGVGGIGDVSRTRIAESKLKQESIRFGQIADRVVRQVVENRIHADSAKEQLDLAKLEIAAAEETLKLSQDRLKQGSALTIEVLAAEDELFAAKSRAAQSISEYNKAQYGLLRSIGGFRGSDAAAAGLP